VKNLKESIDQFLKLRRELQEEGIDFHRFDNDFVAPDVTRLLGGLPQNVEFTPADLKAMLGTETGDFSNTNIAGLKKDTGITGGPKNKSFVGIAQIGGPALESIKNNQGALGLTIPKKGDWRKDAAHGIILAAAYLRLVADQLVANLPAPTPTGVEFKKMLMAAYNGGQGWVVVMANAYSEKHPGAPYTWDLIKELGVLPAPTDKKNYRKEMKGYVTGWEERTRP
jgi:hypothetical protein